MDEWRILQELPHAQCKEPFTTENIPSFLQKRHPILLQEVLGGAVTAVTEVSDGNINMVFKVIGSNGTVLCVKQALPCIRILPEILLDPKRILFEWILLNVFRSVDEMFVPKLYEFDHEHMCIIMEFMDGYQVLREILSPDMIETGAIIGNRLALCAFETSVYKMDAQLRRQLKQVIGGNHKMCSLTDEFLFSGPLRVDGKFPNSCLPQLASFVKAVQADATIEACMGHWKSRFSNVGETLCHGDVHTGSFLVSSDVRIFDGEFAFFGPFGFDMGVLFGNILLNAIAKDDILILGVLESAWNAFEATFVSSLLGENTIPGVFRCNGVGNRSKLMEEVWSDVVGFAGCEIVRRIIGVASVADFTEERALREGCALRVGIAMVSKALPNTAALVHLVECTSKSSDGDPLVFSENITENKFEVKTVVINVVAKLPKIGKCKTRLAKTIGPELTLEFADSCLSGVLDRFKHVLNEHQQWKVQHRIVFWPSSDRAAYHTWLTANKIDGWELVPVKVMDDGAGTLGDGLTGAMSRADAVVFMGMDTPQLKVSELVAGIESVLDDPQSAFISPAEDGGYVLLVVPGLNQNLDYFNQVLWSSNATFATQMKAIQKAGIQKVKVGELYMDVDTIEDVDFFVLNKDRLDLPSSVVDFLNSYQERLKQ